MNDIIYIIFEGEFEDVYVDLVTTNQDKAINKFLNSERKEIEVWKNEKRIGDIYTYRDKDYKLEDVKERIEKMILEG